MVHIYTFCDKTLIGKKQNLVSGFLCENLYKINFKIEEACVFCNKYDYQKINFKNKDMYFLLLQKSNSTLNSYLAELANCEVKENGILKKVVQDKYKYENIPIDVSAELDWCIPEKAIPITNPRGKTQGYILKLNETVIFVLPNDFEQFKLIYDDCLLDFIEKNYAINYKSETYKTFGLTEDNLQSILKDQIKNKDKVYVSIFSRNLDNDVVIKAKEDNEHFEEYRRIIYSKIENYIYSVQDYSMEHYLEKLIENDNVKISFATDFNPKDLLFGMSSNLMKKSISQFVCLPNLKTKKDFGINSDLLQQGEVSAEVAYEISLVLQKNNTDISVVILCSFDELNKGTTFIAIGNKNKIDIYKNKFTGNNEDIIKNVSLTAKFYLIKKLMSRDYKIL